jgi:copper(I)-binding protein
MRPRSVRLLLAVVAAMALAACSSGAGSSPAAPLIVEPWARAAAAGGQSAAYFTITNTSTAAEALLSATSPAASMIEVHETSIDGSGVAAMHPVDKVDIPAGESVVLKPGSYHLMLMGLKGELAVGQTVELDLVFEHAGKVVVQAEVRQG